MKTRRQKYRNDRSSSIDVLVEAWPERYVLKPGDEMEIEAEIVSDEREAFYIVVTETGLQIYPEIGTAERVWINGEPAKEDWEGAS